ncbi:MAG: DUF2085 domain-containing protein [Candidatus Thermoplasmatota archaeon]|nr:DUF2085 domain-containing protein [Candidatus Thermoplasmatota archaeon]
MMERRERASKIILGAFAIFFLWTLFQIVAPVLLPSHSIQDLSGQTGVVDNDHITDTMPFPINGVYGCGDRLCHQRSDRSFFINGNQMPFCSRCTAIWIGFSIGLLFLSFFKVPLDERLIFIILISLIPIGIDGVGQLLGFWESTNIVRVITGVIIGIMCGIAIGILIEEAKNWFKTKKVNN